MALGGSSLKLLTSYLTNRQQLTYINGVSSHLRELKCGVPQGSILGPLLFLIYINDLLYSTHNLQYVLFADDTSVFGGVKVQILNLYLIMLMINLITLVIG